VFGFDLMDTLVYDPYREAIESVTGIAFDQLRALRDPEAWPAFELGQIDGDEYARRYFKNRAVPALDFAALQAAMFARYRLLEGMEPLLERLAGDHQICIMSNYNRPWYEEVRARFALDRYVSAHYPSFEIGARKPEPRYFQSVLERLSIPASALVFIDDRAVNVQAAREAGITAIRFESSSQLAEELDRL
jgi:putative hydrolase of the HAD superfamily